MKKKICLPGSFWLSTIIACLERALTASYGYSYVGVGYKTGATRWRCEEDHDPPHEHRLGLLTSAGVVLQAWEEGRVSLLWGLIRFWRKTGNRIVVERMLKDIKRCSICLDITLDDEIPLLEEEIQKIERRLLFELELTGEAA